MNITIEELLKKQNRNIIDIRDYNQYQMGHIPGAVSIDAYQLSVSPEKFLKKDSIYYIYCSSGSRSSRLVNMLNRSGYYTVNIIGGYHNYLLRK